MSGQPESIVAKRLEDRFGRAPAEAIVAAALERFDGRIAVLSSFGADAAVLLHMVAAFDRSVPVLMLDTGLLFAETLDYRQQLAAHLGLRDLRSLQPDETGDTDRSLHLRDTHACCQMRKVAPLARALGGMAAVITGRKRFQTAHRQTMTAFAPGEDGRISVNPLVGWSRADLLAYRERHDLPPHPLVARGFPSIGCRPCTTPVAPGESERAGRWRGEARQECGIHFSADGTVRRSIA